MRPKRLWILNQAPSEAKYWSLGLSPRVESELLAYGDGEAPPNAIYPYIRTGGNKPADIPDAALVKNLLVSTRVLNALRTTNVGALRAQQAEVRNRDDKTVLSTEYWVIWPQVGAGPVNRQRGIFLKYDRRLRQACPALSPFGLEFDRSTLSDLDVFCFPNTFDVVLTSRAVRAVLATHPRGLGIADLMRVGDEVDDEYDLSRLTPDVLSD